MIAGIVYEHSAPTALIVAALVVAAACAVGSLLRHVPWKRWHAFLVLLRLPFLLLLAWCLLLPIVRRSLTEQIKPRFLVAVDTSASMGIVAPGGGAVTSRWANAQRVLGEPWVRSLQARCEVDVVSFDAKAGAAMTPAKAASLKPEGASTQLRESLGSVFERYKGLNLAGCLLLSDGLDTREVHEDWAGGDWPCRIYTVRLEPPGLRETEPDVRIDSLDTQRRVVVGWDTRLTVAVSGQGTKGDAFSVRLYKDGTLAEEMPVQLPADGGSREAVFRLAHPATGIFQYRVDIPALRGETSTNDNTFSVSVQVVDARNRVLYAEGVPRWESKYLIRNLKANPT